ncbi:1-phosphofructokinase family hexose kinase [Tessaracoccus sp.]
MPTLRTVTLNTGYDDYFTVHDLSWGGVGRSTGFRSVPSGKGISCARAAHALGVPVRAYALIGQGDLPEYSGRLALEGLDHHLVAVPGVTRHNLTLIDGSGHEVAAHFMAPGFTVDGPETVEPLVQRLLHDIEPGDVVTLNGSTPAGLPEDTWARFAREALGQGARVIVDAQGAAFREAMSVPGILAFKPNDEEILALPRVADAAPESRTAVGLAVLAGTGVQIPLVSRGAQGVSFLRDGQVVTLSCPVADPVQSVMAGDTFVAGLAWGLLGGASDDDCLRHALAAAAAHVAGLSGEALRTRALANLARIL